MRLQDILTERAANTPDRTAVAAGRTRLSYAALDAMSDSLAATLAEGGAGRGERVAVFSDTWAESVVAVLAALKAGATCCPIHPLTAVESLTGLLRAWRARALVTEARLAGTAAAAIRRAESVRLVVLSGTPERQAAAGCIRFEDAVVRHKAGPASDTSGADIAFLLSDEQPGSVPGAILVRHSDFAASLDKARRTGREEDAIITSLCLAGRAGLLQLFCAMRDGITLMHSTSGAADARPMATPRDGQRAAFSGR